MTASSRNLKYWVYLTAFLFVLGCGESKEFTVTVIHPLMVIGTSPANGADDFGLDSPVVATFSDPLKSSTVDEKTVYVLDSAGNLFPGAVSAEAERVTWTPDTSFDYTAEYTLYLTKGIKRASDGAVLAYEIVTTFKTIDPPSLVMSMASPGDGANNVGTFIDPIGGAPTPYGSKVSTTIVIKFSEGIERGTVDNQSISIINGATSSTINGALSFGSSKPGDPIYTDDTITFSPNQYLPLSTPIKVTLDESIWSLRRTPENGELENAPIEVEFSTADPPPLSVINSTPPDGSDKVGVIIDSNSGAPDEFGDAVLAEMALLFSESLNPNSVSASTVYLEKIDGPTATPVSGQLIIDSDTAGAPAEWFAGNRLSFKPDSPLEFSSTYRLTISAGPAGVESYRATAGGGQLPGSDILITFQTVDPPPVLLLLSTPASGADDISRAVDIGLIFSEPIDAASINSTTIALASASGQNISLGAISFPSPNSALINIDPQAGEVTEAGYLDFSTVYTITLTGGAAGIAGSRQTMGGGWLTPETIELPFKVEDPPSFVLVASDPSGSSADIVIDTDIELIFDQGVDFSNVDDSLLYLYAVTEPSAKIPAAITNPAPTKLVVTPTDNLNYNSDYRIHLEGGGYNKLRSVNATFERGYLSETLEFTFHTRRHPPLTVESTTPADGDSATPTNTAIRIVFSNSILRSTLTAEPLSSQVDGYQPNLFIYQGLPSDYSDPASATAAAISGSFTFPDEKTVVFTPDATLGFDANYTLVASSDIIDVDSERLASTFTSTFRTRVSSLISSISPYDGETGVDISRPIIVDFVTLIDSTTINTSSMYITWTDDLGITRIVPGAFSFFDSTADGDPNTIDRAIFTPSESTGPCANYNLPLQYGTAYDINFRSLITTADGSASLTPLVSSFTTGLPTSISGGYASNGTATINLSPSAPATDVPISSEFYLVFAGPMDDSTINNTTLLLNGGAVTGTVSHVEGYTYKFSPAAALEYNTGYSLTLIGDVGGVADASGSYLPGSVSVYFTTSPKTSWVLIPDEGGTSDQGDSINIIFDRELLPSTVNDSSVIFTDISTPGAPLVKTGIIGFDSKTKTLSFTPVPEYQTASVYKLVLTTAITDYAGNRLPNMIVINQTGGGAANTCKADFSISSPVANISGDATIDIFSDDTFSFTGLKEPNVVITDSGGNRVPYAITSVVPSGIADYTVSLTPDNYLRSADGPYSIDIDNLADLTRNYCSNSLPLSTPITIEGAGPVFSTLSPNTPARATDPIVVTFDEAIDPAGVSNGLTFFLTDEATCPPVTFVNGEASVSGAVLTFSPDLPLDAAITYRVCLTAGITDTAGNANTSIGDVGSFDIEAVNPDLVNYSLIADPAGPIRLLFTEPMDIASIFSSPIPGSLALDYTDACGAPRAALCCVQPRGGAYTSDSFDCSVPGGLPGDTSIDIGLDSAIVADLAGNLLTADYLDTFITASGPPMVSCSTPPNGAASAATADITILFNEDVAPGTVDANSIIIYRTDTGQEIAGGFSVVGNVVTFTPTSALSAGVNYEVVVTPGVTDLGGVPLKRDYWFGFTQ